MIVGQQIGTWSSEGSTTSAVFDNFNVWHPVYVYDANGNMTSDGTNCYVYNDANQLSTVKQCGNSQTVAEYTYDYNGNRMVKKNYLRGTHVNTVTSWSDSYETKAIVGGGSENTAYYWVNGELLAKKDNSGNRFYYHNDHLGSASVLTNSSGTVVETTKYDPWGLVLAGGTKSKFQYTGQEKDGETGLNYYNARYYDSHIRRFTQPDTIIQNAFQPQTLNRYSYVQNNPLKYTDPTGHVSILDYNKMLSNPTAQSYNNVMSQFAALPGKQVLPGFAASKATSSNKNSGNSVGSVVAAGSVTQNRALGNAYEAKALQANGYAKNTSLIANYGNRIPDIDAQDVGDVKRVKYLSNSGQLRDIIEYARATNRTCVIVCPIETDISRPLQSNLESLGEGKSKIIRFGSILKDSALKSELPMYFIHPAVVSPNYLNQLESSEKL